MARKKFIRSSKLGRKLDKVLKDDRKIVLSIEEWKCVIQKYRNGLVR